MEGPTIVDPRTLLYRRAGTIFRNDLPEACPALHPDALLVVEMQGIRLCRDDRFHVVDRDSRLPSGACRLGGFTPFRRAPRG